MRFILIYSSSFTYAENERLLQLFNRLGIKGSVFSSEDLRTGKIYHGIQISKTSTQRYLEYLNQAPKEALTLAKQLFPWKFSIVNRKKDVIRDPDYILTFLDLLAHSLVGSEEKLTTRIKPLLRRFPWNETLFHLTLY